MSRFYTIMVIPEKEKGVKSFRVPRIIFNSFIFFILVVVAIIGILSYDYVKILRQVYENRHLSIENRQLKEQIQLFNMKLNTLTDDIERVQQFEKKLRVITGFKEVNQAKPLKYNPGMEAKDADHDSKMPKERSPDSISLPTEEDDLIKEVKKSVDEVSQVEKFQDIKDLYERKIATNFGLLTGYSYTKEWNELIKQSFKLAVSFAYFDYRFSIMRQVAGALENRINGLDQYLLDKDSFLKSTPTLLPSWGWITSSPTPKF